MILGVGVELVDTRRFEAALARFEGRMKRRLFSETERRYAAEGRRGAQSLAARFAAKVAVRRSLGLRQLTWTEAEIVGKRGQAPRLILHGEAEARARALGVRDVHVTLTHDACWCVGHVVLGGDG